MCLRPRKFNGMMCPCGECEECIRMKANGEMQVLTDCAKRYNTLYFVTFTYDDENCPLYVRRVSADKTRDDFKYKYQFDTYARRNAGERPLPRMEEALRRKYTFLKSKNAPTNNSVEVMEYKGEQYRVAASLCRRDIQNTMKIFRINYARLYKKTKDEKYKLNFKYYIRGEYGPQTSRPHYHGLFFGLTLEQVTSLCKLWRRGLTDCKEVQRSEKDFSNATRYVSNYINKADFEPECVKQYVCEKPRVQCSTGMIQLSQQEIINYTGQDLGLTLHDSYYDADDIERVYNRLTKMVGNSEYKLCDKYRKKVFYETVTEIDFWTGEKKTRRIATPLQNAITLFTQLRHMADSEEEFRQLQAEIQMAADRSEVVNRFYDTKFRAIEDRRKDAVRRIQQNVRKSHF